MDQCRTEIELLKDELEFDIWTFRWLWLINLLALVWGLVVHQYAVALLAAVSALIALIGIGRTRRGRRIVKTVGQVCVPAQVSVLETDSEASDD